jgi:hypothetical protein
LTVVKQAIHDYWLLESPDEPGASTHRVSFVDIDIAKGTATGYLAKYIAKNIDAFQVDLDHEAGIEAIEGVKRVDAWAATHRIRQFQQIGGPPVGLWRELRRLRSTIPHAEIEAVRAPVDTGDYRSFVGAVGGIATGRSTRVRLWKADDGYRNRYGERRGPRVVGLESSGARFRTRFRQWRIVFGDVLTRLIFSPWTRVNNCTRPISAPFGASPAQFAGRGRSPPVQPVASALWPAVGRRSAGQWPAPPRPTTTYPAELSSSSYRRPLISDSPANADAHCCVLPAIAGACRQAH